MAGFVANPRKPKLKLPPGACDTHFHVFGPFDRFPAARDAAYKPAGDAPKEALFRLHEHLGIERGVVVQTAVYGFDNSASADLIAAKPQTYKGIALVPPDVKDETLKKLDGQGFVGARFHYMKLQHLGTHVPIEEVIALGKRLARLGWHLQIHLDATLLPQLAPALHRSPVPVVIDHIGRIDASTGAGFGDLLRLLEDDNIYVKVSAPERASKEGRPWRDAIAYGRKLVAEFGGRVLWGSDWPHPNLADIPDDGDLVDYIEEIAPDAAARERMLVKNPAKLYRFR